MDKSDLEKLSPEVLQEGFALLYREFKDNNTNTAPQVIKSTEPEIPNFVSLIQHMKSKYTFPELNDLTVEGGRVFFRRGGRKIELSREEEEVKNTPPPQRDNDTTAETGRFSQLELN